MIKLIKKYFKINPEVRFFYGNERKKWKKTI